MEYDEKKLLAYTEDVLSPESSYPVNSTAGVLNDDGIVSPLVGPPDYPGSSVDVGGMHEKSDTSPQNLVVAKPVMAEKPEIPPAGDGSINYPHDDETRRTMDDDVTGDSESKTKITWRQKLTFVGIACTYLTWLMSFSILAPFFPYEAKEKGLSPSETGFIFGLFALVSFLAAPVFGKYLPVIGAKFMLLSGLFISAGCNILFGFLDGIDDTEVFLVYCFVIRAVEALGSAATITAGMAIVANVFPENVAQVGGMLEVFSGIGFAIGPPFGSLLYGIGGYKLPFLVLGGIAIIIDVANMFIIPSVSSTAKKEKPGSLLSVLKIPAVWVSCSACSLGSACLGFNDATLSLHLTGDDFNVSPQKVGYLFLLIGGLYGATAPVWGYLADKKKATRFMMAIGSWLAGVSFLLMGPSPLLNLPNQLWIIIFALSLLGFSIGCSLQPIFLDLLITANWYGLPDDLSTQAIVSGMFNGFYSFGTFLGPTVAGVLMDHIGFDWSATIFACGNFVVMIIVCLFGVWEFQWGKGRRKPNNPASQQVAATPDDKEPLVVEA